MQFHHKSWMNTHMNELHGVGIYGIITPSSDKFNEERTWACLDIIDETREPS